MSRSEDAGFRGWRFETFEDRLALSAQPVADFWYDTSSQSDAAAQSIAELSSTSIQPLTTVQPLSTAEGHGWTDLAAARNQYGLYGQGQTVAIIDSGIAYDQKALGGGFGTSYKVVGGWDFAENDANPYDDGPAGFHGTHVSGIVGSQDSKYSGVAPDVDLVGLRVFDDQGNGYFTWVDQALQWVHQHRNDYEFPITTVNLSLGTEWNANTLPQWATLESDLKQLADDGIFIAVAAGNSFKQYNSPGLSYPAVSPYVTPVASVDASGNLSSFSQRNQNVLAAPGEKITSTVPDAFYGGDPSKNDWGAASGTSMASPYVAGASVLVREAMQDLGYSNITETTIDKLFHQTADKVFDSVTNANYDRINVARALSSLVGADDYGSTSSAATAVGNLTTKLDVSGTIGSTTDQDYFRFTATATGQASFTLTGGQQLGATWEPAAGEQIVGHKLTMNVVAGQSYVVGVGGGGVTIGKYSVDMQLTPASTTPTINPINWGTIDQRQINNIAVTGGDAWFQVTASHSGRFTAEAFSNQTSGNVDLELYDSHQHLVGSSSGLTGSERIDIDAKAGDTFFLHVKGNNSDVDFRLTNLVSIAGNTARVSGTTGNDLVQYQSNGQIAVNGVNYSLAGVTQISIDGSGGNDTLTLSGGNVAETIVFRPGSADLNSATTHVIAGGFETIQFIGGNADRATFYDSAANDVFEAQARFARMIGPGFANSATGVQYVQAISSAGGNDRASLTGSDGNDVLGVWAGSRTLSSAGTQIGASGFQFVQFNGGGGFDYIDYYAADLTPSIYGRGGYGDIIDQAFETQFSGVEMMLARVRTSQRLQSDLAALDYAFQKIGRN
ncbi:MAG TPA: S8 family serine peptidase [Pirellulaceae bacterium]|jgi:hypothetical protein